jgi:hypothetical protein
MTMLCRQVNISFVHLLINTAAFAYPSRPVVATTVKPTLDSWLIIWLFFSWIKRLVDGAVHQQSL